MATTQISLLVPHPRRLAVLVGADDGLTLPTMRLPGTEPALADIVAACEAVGLATYDGAAAGRHLRPR